MKAIITGISGQDGHYMARLLAARGYELIGLTSMPDKDGAVRQELAGLPVEVITFDYSAPGAMEHLIDAVRPKLIFNFAAKATGQGMFAEPFAMARVNGHFVLDILEGIRKIDPSISFCQASSAEMYGDVETCPQDEQTAFRPKSPYGAAKLYGHNLIGIYRKAFAMRCSSAILYNHESVRRSTAFVTRKIAQAAARISLGLDRELTLGSLDSLRDWGYAPEYVEAMYLMATSEGPSDYVVATGNLTSVERVCDICFSRVGLDYRSFVKLDPGLKRLIETTNVCGNPAAIERDLGWKAKTSVETMLIEMVDFDVRALTASPDAVCALS